MCKAIAVTFKTSEYTDITQTTVFGTIMILMVSIAFGVGMMYADYKTVIQCKQQGQVNVMHVSDRVVSCKVN